MGIPLRIAEAGAMIRAAWYDQFSQHPGGIGSWLIAVPCDGDWVTSQQATGGGWWTAITVTPSIWHNAPHGWHGFIRDGELVDA